MFTFHLRSRFGRRLFGLSLLAALLPMAGLAAFAYQGLYKQLVDAMHGTLRQESKGLGMELISDLGRRADELRRFAAGDVVDVPGGFTWAGAVGAADAPEPDLSERVALAQHGLALRLRADEPAVLMVRDTAGTGAIAGRIHQPSLWKRDMIDSPYCVLDAQQLPLYCSAGLSPPAEARASVNDRSVFALKVGTERYMGSYWHGRLDGLFGATGFIVLMTAPEQALTAPLDRLRLAFGAMFMLALGLAVWLSASQIRRHTQPLDTLMRGVNRLARGELDARVEVQGDDEFALFGRTLNTMSVNLQSQFNLLRLLAELDRVVLGACDRESVTSTILLHVLDAIPCDGAGILTLDEGGSDVGGTYRQAFRPDAPRPPAQNVPAELVSSIAQHCACENGMLDRDIGSCLAGQRERAGRRTMLFPVMARERLDSVLVLSLRRDSDDIETIRDAGRNLADRMAVAGSSIDWEEKLYRQSHFDPLTGLPNRMLLRDRVAQALVRAERDGAVVAMLVIHLYDFDNVGEALGQASGDEFLVESARRLEALRRPNETVARLGGNEFAMLVDDLSHADVMTTLHGVAERIDHALAEPMMLSGHEVIQTVGIGISLYPDNAQSFESLLKLAAVALQEARNSGKTQFHFYSHSMNRAATGRFELAQDLRRAISNDELLLFFQPKVAAGIDEVRGAEALIRWRSPTRGVVPPGVFLPVLEDLGLNSWLTVFVLDRACAQMAAWDRAGFAPIPVSVNVSPSDLAQSDFCERVVRVLAQHGLAPNRLELEILESSEIGPGTGVRENLVSLRLMGVRIALDDFGTGYSSLVYLTEIPADVLKLDRAFIRNMVDDVRQQSIVERVISLAQSLDLKVVAEGVEETAQRELLAAMRCDMIQGYLFSRPVPAEEFAAHLRQREGALEAA